MTMQSDIRAAASGLTAGATTRVVCPFCNAQHERSLAITRASSEPWKLLFNCHRGKCAQSGMVLDEDGAHLILSPTEPQPRKANKVLSEHQRLPGRMDVLLSHKYALAQGVLKQQGCRWETEGQALCMPWLDEHGKQVGWVEKRFDSRWHKSHHEKASYSYEGRMAFPRTGFSYQQSRRDRICILVEGLLDAYKLLSHRPPQDSHDPMPVALLGAQVSNGDAFRLSQMFENVVVLLDPDQWPAGSMRVGSRFAPMPVNVRLMTLDTDPKDAAAAALDNFFNNLSAAF